MSELTPRLERRVIRDFPRIADQNDVRRLVADVSESERAQAAVVFASSGSLDEIRAQIRLAEVDWRVVLMNGELALDDWERRLDQELG